MDNSEVKIFVEAFRGYRDLLDPIQKSLGDFMETYGSIQNNIETLNTAFGGGIKERLEDIYKDLSSQAEKASDLSSRIDQFSKTANKYTSEVGRILEMFGKVEERLSAVNAIETKAEEQIGRLDALLEEKQKNYNVKELQRTLDSYNANVEKVSEFINKNVAESLAESSKTLGVIRGGFEDVVKKQKDESATLEQLLESYSSSAALLKKISEKQDVNEAYIFDILDAWAESRRVKTKK